MTTFDIPSIEKVFFRTELEVRIRDINYGNHLDHSALISLLHEARIRFLKQHGFSEGNIAGAGILITSLAVAYLGEAFYGDALRIEIGVGEISYTSVELLYQAVNRNTNKKIALATTTVTFFDYQARKVVRVPQVFLGALTSLLQNE